MEENKIGGTVFLVVIAIFFLSSWYLQEKKEEHQDEMFKKVCELQDELDNIQDRINEIDSFSYDISSYNTSFYSVDEDLLRSMYDVLNAKTETEKNEAIENLRYFVSERTMYDFEYSINGDSIPFVGEEATWDAYRMTEELFELIYE